MRCLPIIASLALLAGCEGEPEGADDRNEGGAERTLPGVEEVRAQEAAARRAADAITEENADDTLEELEAVIGGEDE